MLLDGLTISSMTLVELPEAGKYLDTSATTGSDRVEVELKSTLNNSGDSSLLVRRLLEREFDGITKKLDVYIVVRGDFTDFTSADIRGASNNARAILGETATVDVIESIKDGRL